MEALDVEQGSYSNSNSFAQRASALFASLGLTRRHRFEQLPQDEVEEIQKVVQAAGKREGLRWCPEEEAGVVATCVYSFCSGLIRIGYRKPLLQEDLWDVNGKDEASKVCGRFQEIMDQTKLQVTSPKGSVLRTMWRAHARVFIMIGGIKLFDNILTFASPLLLERLLLNLQEGKPAGITLAVALAMFITNATESIVNNRQMHYSMRMVMHLKSQMIGMLYGKSLLLHSAARLEFSTGQIVNLQSNDAQKLWWLPLFMHVLWSAPLQILVVCLLLVRVMGIWPAVAGLMTTLLLIPTSSFVGKRLAAARKAVVAQTDARVKLTTEAILGIRAIKLYSWETPFLARIMDLRHRELAAIRLAAIYNALNTMLFIGGPVFISLAAFTVYGALGYQLTAAVAFPCLSLFNLLRFPLMMLPEQILNVIQGKVALSRIQKFMNADEMDQGALKPAAIAGETAVAIQHGNFAWEAGAPNTLSDLNLEVEAGRLVIIVGEVGSGKSSVLCALLGEMIARGGGDVAVKGRVGYTAQDPWICNATLRQNVVMSADFDQARYDRTLDACALRPDLAELAGGDLAEIGEKGVNLSGGQRARVSLARACYTGADVYLLDDPLSAVDPHVGQHLFEKCICGVLAPTTRLLVTHQLQFLPSADVVVVLSAGRISHIGSYQDLVEAGVEFRQFTMNAEEEEGEDDSVTGADLPYAAEELASSLLSTTVPNADDFLPEAACGAVPAEALPSIEVLHKEGAAAEGSEWQLNSKQGFYRQDQADWRLQHQIEAFARQASSSGDENRPPADHSETPSGGAASAAFQDRPALLAQSANSLDLGGLLPCTRLQDLTCKQGASATSKQSMGGFGSPSVQLAPVLENSSPRVQAKTARALSRGGSRGVSTGSIAGHAAKLQTGKPDAGKIMEKEERATGHVELRMYKIYLRAWSSVAFVLPIALLLLATSERLLQVLQNFWLSIWTDKTVAVSAQQTPLDNRPYIGIYFALGAAAMLFQGGRLLVTVKGSINAANQMHAKLLEKVMRLPLSFFSSQPTGRLLNRFARDTEAVDNKVPQALGSFLNCFVNVLGSIAINIVVTPLVIIPVLPMAYVYDAVRRRFVTTSREIKRLDSLAMSPIFGVFSETLQGLVSVRAFRLQQDFSKRHNAHLDASTRCWWPLVCTARWLSIRLELIGAGLVFFTAVASAVLLPQSAGLAGLAITAALNLTGLLNWTVRQSTELEVQMNSVERMMAYTTEYEAERPAVVLGKRPPKDWPAEGQITLDNLVIKYRPDLPPVLKGLCLNVKKREKVGVAGRTGGGKSTLMMSYYSATYKALFRIVEPTSGTIYIDGLDITEMGLSDLRSRLALVPQDPVIFSGSVRANLDPFDSIDGDAPIWQALERAGLQRTIADLPGGLDADIAEGGTNLSTGQRQLLCMARALLRQSRVLVLDEATSSIDSETDGLIQATVRTAFAECTVLTVAHRLHTISDCDRILVLDSGTVREFDSPQKLLKDPSSAFYSLVAETTRQQSKLGSWRS